MTKQMNFIIKISMCIFFILPLSGCWSRHELNTLSFVVGVGLDKTQEPGKIQLTTQVAKPGDLKSAKSDVDGRGQGAKAYWNLKNTGSIASDIIKDSNHQSSHQLNFSHNQVLIIDKILAEEGVQKVVDTFIRGHKTRLGIWVLVSENKASEVLDVTPELEKLPAMNISKLIEVQTGTSEAPAIKFIDFIARLMSKTTSPIAPLLTVTGEGNEKTVAVAGTAVFKQDKFVGQLNKRETRGLLWVMNEVKSGMIDIAGPDGNGKVSVEITGAKSKIIPEIKDALIHMKIELKAEGIIGSQTSLQNLTSLPMTAALEKKLAAEIESEILAALKKARDLNSDIFGFGDTIHWKYPKEWKKLEERWDDVFPEVEVELNIDAKLRSTGSISSPAVPAKE